MNKTKTVEIIFDRKNNEMFYKNVIIQPAFVKHSIKEFIKAELPKRTRKGKTYTVDRTSNRVYSIYIQA